MSNLSRRDFLKLAGLASGTVALSPLTAQFMRNQSSDLPNIIILVFDAMSARNLSLYGYERDTTPNLQKFAERANVYHKHYSSGNFTTPGTASLLTGTYPWTHRALNLSGLVDRDLVEHNIFSAFGSNYHRLAFSQNIHPNYFFGQFSKDIETILPLSSFSAFEQIHAESFTNDMQSAYRSLDHFLFNVGTPPGSLIFGLANHILFRRREARVGVDANYTRLPRAEAENLYFRLEDVFEGVNATIREKASKGPYLAYMHLYAPHEPFRPSIEFEKLFRDKFRPIWKPEHRFGDHIEYYKLRTHRRIYDQYIANVDAEFGKLIDRLNESGAIDNSFVVITSDHGQSFERGLELHFTRLLYEPLIHIPLLISAPGQNTRRDIYSPTNNVDILPTLLHLSGRSVPNWTEGALLPKLGGAEDMDRSLFTVEAKENIAFAPITRATVALIKAGYKLIYYIGYEAEDSFELYDLENDYEELNDLHPARPAISKVMKDELLEKLNTVNAKYRKL